MFRKAWTQFWTESAQNYEGQEWQKRFELENGHVYSGSGPKYMTGCLRKIIEYVLIVRSTAVRLH